MRHADRLDWRDRAYKKKYPVVLVRAEISGAPALGPSVTAELLPPISIVCGLNGSGKSRLLRVLAEMISPGSVPDAAIARQVGGAACVLTLRNAEGDTTIRRPSADASPLKTLWFDPVLLTAEISRQFRDIVDLTDILDGVEVRPFDDALLGLARLVLQRDYTSIQSFDLSEDGFKHPYFQVRWQDVTYGAEDMALGELSCVYLLYLLSRADASTMVFLEEPESFLSPIGQVNLMDCVHYYCKSKALTFLISTHSPSIAAQVPASNLSCVDRAPSGVVVVRSPPQLESLSAIAIGERVGGLVFVEDFVAESLVREVLRRACASYRHLIEVVNSGGKDNVRRALKSVKALATRLPSVGVLDGDAREDPPESGLHLFFLPGDGSPDRLLRNAATAAPDRLAGAIGLSPSTVNAAMARASGAEDHDWSGVLGDAVGLPRGRMTAALIDVWFQVPENAAAAKQLFADVCAKIPGL